MVVALDTNGVVVALDTYGVVIALNYFQEQGWTILHILGEDLQKVTRIIKIHQDLQLL